MSIEANKAIVRRIHEDLESRGDLRVADEVYGPDVVTSRWAERLPGAEGVKRHLVMLRTAFPDLQVTIFDLVGERDEVVARLTMRATHRGPFRGRPPTGVAVEWSGVVIRRIVDGRVIAEWSLFDTQTLIQ